MSKTSVLDSALSYRRRGWSLIPMRMATKRPARKWARYQTTLASEQELARWFGGPRPYGIAVVFGAVSGGLASRDFDDMAAYERWAADHPDLAQLLPTVGTRRRRHVYCRTTPEDVAKLRDVICKPGTGAIHCGDGELRAGVGCYSVLPPSRHPSGHVYQWLIPLEGQLPTVDLLLSGLIHIPAERPRSLAHRVCPAVSRDHDHGNVDERARRYLAKLPPAIQGQCGSNPTFNAACLLVLGFDLHPDQAMPLLQEYSDRCVPPWSEEELWHKLNDADAKPGPRGYLLQAARRWEPSKQFRSATVARAYRHAVDHRIKQRRRRRS